MARNNRPWTEGLHDLADVEAEYRRAFEQSTRLVFAAPEWLAALGPDNVRILAADGDDGRVFVPVSVGRRRGVRTVSNPPLMPWVFPVSEALRPSNMPSRISRANHVGSAIAAALPTGALIKLRLHPTFPSFLGFHWAGFTAMTRISYRIDPSTSESAFASLKSETRTDVRRAERSAVEVDLSPEPMLAARFFDAHARETGFNHPLGVDALAATLRRVVNTDFATLWAARVGGEMVGAALVASDPTCTYYLLAASSERARQTRAMSLLVWTAVAATLETGRAFDFEGSMIPGVERFNRSFGGRQVLDPVLVRPPYGQRLLKIVRRVV